MGQTIYEQIEEAEKTLNLEHEGDDNGDTDNDLSIQRGKGDGRVRGQSGQQSGARPEQGETEGNDAGSDGRASGDAPRGESGTPSEDAGTRKRLGGKSRSGSKDAPETGGGTQEDARPSQEDGESDDGRVHGKSGHDSGSVEENQDQPEKPLTNADWARLRREKRELEAKLKQLEAAKPSIPAAEAKIAEKPAEAVKSPEKAAEPDKNVNYQAWLEWKLSQTDNTIQEQNKLIEEYKGWRAETTKERETQTAINNAVQEFQSLEETYQQKNPDYLNAMEFARNKYAEALKITNPQMTAKQIDAKIDYDILAFASQKSAAGLNPAEELYDMAMERFGYQKAANRQAEIEEEAPRRQAEKPNLKVISNNKRRSASPLSGGGQGGNMPLTPEVAVGMTMGEFSNLSPDELAQLESQG
jgi:hypothetical protein